MVSRLSACLFAAILAASNAWAAEHWSPLPPPVVPADNPLSAAKAELGKQLFHESRLSVTGDYSCASCHQPARHFADGRPVAIGALGDLLPRNTPSLYNAAYNASYGWDDQGITTLEQQHRIPLFNADPIEMGFEPEMVDLLRQDPALTQAFEAAFGGAPSVQLVIQALASYVRTIRPPRTPFDEYLFFDDADALSPDAHKGMALFFSDRLGCSRCHASLTFSGPISHAVEQAPPVFHVTGVNGSSTPFRAPSLRMVQYTAPYMHDGSLATLADVIDHYQNTSAERVPDFALTEREAKQLVAFLQTL